MAAIKFHTTEKLGKKQSLTPEGFLLCEDVPIARTGLMIYGPDETPIEIGPDGMVKVMRMAEDVFSEVTIASFQGKPVTSNHPEDDVNPGNWRELAVGICINPRRGIGAYDDLLLADLLITEAQSIKEVQDGLREVSCGYEADYRETGLGTGIQHNIVGNHIALVESGRCGPRCAIGDHLSTVEKEKENQTMAKKNWMQRARDAFKAKDEGALEEALKEGTKDDDLEGATVEGKEGGDTHIHIHSGGAPGAEAMGDEESEEEKRKLGKVGNDEESGEEQGAENARFDALEARVAALEALATNTQAGAGDAIDPELEEELAEEAPESAKDAARKAKDSTYLADSYQDTVAKAEILAPGIRIPTFHRDSAPAQSMTAICSFRRQALDLAYVQPATRGVIEELLSGKALDTRKMSCGAVRHLFNNAATVRSQLNKDSARKSTFFAGDQAGAGKKPVSSIAELNARNKAKYS